jgi:hypothetical protein
MVNKNDAIGWNEWRKLPVEDQMAWRIPITMMFNLTHLRRTHPVILTSEYLRLHNFSTDVEWSNGAWLRSTYHEHANVFESDPDRKPSLQVIENSWYDPRGINRVDVLPTHMRLRGDWREDLGNPAFGQKGGWGNNVTTAISRMLLATLPADKSVLSWEQAQAILQDVMHDENQKHGALGHPASAGAISSNVKVGRKRDVSADEELERVLRLNGWEVLYTYSGA